MTQCGQVCFALFQGGCSGGRAYWGLEFGKRPAALATTVSKFSQCRVPRAHILSKSELSQRAGLVGGRGRGGEALQDSPASFPTFDFKLTLCLPPAL